MNNLLISIIRKKLPFCEDLLNLCLIYNDKKNDNNDSGSDNGELWNCLINLCDDIIKNGNKKDWYYFKTFILSSNVGPIFSLL